MSRSRGRNRERRQSKSKHASIKRDERARGRPTRSGSWPRDLGFIAHIKAAALLWLNPEQLGQQTASSPSGRRRNAIYEAHATRTDEPRTRGFNLGGVQFAVVQLQDPQGRLQVGLGLRQLQLDGPQTVGVGGGQVHPQQRQIHLKVGRKVSSQEASLETVGGKLTTSYLRLCCPRVNCCSVGDSTCGRRANQTPDVWGGEGGAQQNSLFSHAGVFEDVHVDQQGLLVFTHPAQEQRSLLQQAWLRKSEVRDSGVRGAELLGGGEGGGSAEPYRQRESR